MVEHADAGVLAKIGPSDYLECEIQADMYWKPRIEAVVTQWLRTHSEIPVRRIEVIASPRPHQGLGSGTQMACTIAALLLNANGFLLGNPPNPEMAMRSFALEQIAHLSQRGKRSNIGLRGFVDGGFVVDLGMPLQADGGSEIPSRTQRFAFPNWPVIIVRDPSSVGDFGNQEANLFERCRHRCNANRESMIRLVQDEILPAIQTDDWAKWNEALGQYGRWAGEVFEPVQGGIYRTPQIAQSIDIARQIGLSGATQSSWGPTVCAFARDDEHAIWCASRLRTALPHFEVDVTRAANHPAQVSAS